MHNQLLGKFGEDKACEYVRKLGYKIIERNFKARYSELDIIALDGDTLVFVEVKTRIGDEHGLPQEAITRHKIYALTRSIEYYTLLHPELPESLRIDVVSVFLQPDEQVQKIELFKNITI
jgi:putative endonuclease